MKHDMIVFFGRRVIVHELTQRIAESFVAYRDSVGQYMVYADNGQMNARAMARGF